jgi:O-antigen/teichoic acid export membrane protein
MRVGGYIAGALVSAVAAAMLLHHLGRDATGRYGVAVAMVAIVGALSDLGLTAVGVREISLRPPSERWHVAQALLGLRIVLTIIGAALVIAITAVAYSPTLAAGVALASVGLLFQVTQDNFAMPLVVELRLGWVSVLELLRQTLSTVVIVLLVVFGAHLLAFLSVSIPVGVVMVACTVMVVRGQRALRPMFDREQWRSMMSAALPYTAAVAAAALYLRIAMLLVAAISTPAQAGNFTASFRIIEVLTVIPAVLASVAFPIFARAARDDHERLGYALGRVFEVALVVGAWVSVSIAIAAPLAIEIIGGPKFHGASEVLAVQGVALGAMFVSAVWGNGLLGLGMYRQIMLLNLAALASVAAIVTVLVMMDGAQGAAIGTAIVEVGAATANALLVIRGRPKLRPSLRVVPRVALAALLGLAPLAIPGAPVIARLALSSLIYGAVILALRVLPEEVSVLLPSPLRRRSP